MFVGRGASGIPDKKSWSLQKYHTACGVPVTGEKAQAQPLLLCVIHASYLRKYLGMGH